MGKKWSLKRLWKDSVSFRYACIFFILGTFITVLIFLIQLYIQLASVDMQNLVIENISESNKDFVREILQKQAFPEKFKMLENLVEKCNYTKKYSSELAIIQYLYLSGNESEAENKTTFLANKIYNECGTMTLGFWSLSLSAILVVVVVMIGFLVYLLLPSKKAKK